MALPGPEAKGKQMDIIKLVIPIAFGWLLGLLGAPVVDLIRRYREVGEVKAALKTELHELRYRMTCGIMQIKMHLGEVIRADIEWACEIIRGYRGVKLSEDLPDDMLQNYEAMLAYTDDQIAASVKELGELRARQGRVLSLKKYLTPLLDTKIGGLSWLNEESRNKLLQLKIYLSVLGEEIDQSRFYYSLTFQSGITPENHQVASESVAQSYRNYVSQAKMITDLIGTIKL